MPQMAPISWTILFLVFSVSFMIFNIVNYYNKNFFSKNENLKINNKEQNKTNFINWKW